MNDSGALWFPPVLLSVAGVTPQLLQGLFAAAADFFEIQPWKILKGEKVIEVWSPEARLVVVMGAAGQSFGISVYDSSADLQRMYQAQDPLEAAGALCWLALTYETAEYLDQGDLGAIRRYGWRVAGEIAYPSIARIGRFVNLYKEFDADDDELTRTRKLRRAFVEERYKDIVDGLYSSNDKIHMDTTITYEDGRVSRIKADMKILDAPQ